MGLAAGTVFGCSSHLQPLQQQPQDRRADVRVDVVLLNVNRVTLPPGQFALIPGMTLSSKAARYSSLSTATDFVTRVPAERTFKFLIAGSLTMKGQIPIFLEKSLNLQKTDKNRGLDIFYKNSKMDYTEHLLFAAGSHRGRATAERNMTFGMKLLLWT